MAKPAFLINVADLLHRPGARRRERVEGPVEAMRVMDTSVADGATAAVDTMLEWVADGVLASGTATVDWMGLCRRCLTPIGGRVTAEFRELYELHARDGETYPLKGDRIDLEPLARDSLLLELPLAPLCRDDCAGLCPTCGADRNTGPCGCEEEAVDPRWAALDALKGDEPPV